MRIIYWAGIGSRKTPLDVGLLMKELSNKLSNNVKTNFICRSGGAVGADTYFDEGSAPGKMEIFRPSDATPESIQLASQFHPAWDKCNDYDRKLHGRNAQIILGRNLDTPVNFVICWTKNGKDSGGTGLGIRLATRYKIPVYNLHSARVKNLASDFIGKGVDYGSLWK